MRGYWQADQNSARLATRRIELEAVFDDGEFQEATALGYDSERFKRVHRVQAFGLSSHPPKGSHGIALAANGRPDQTVLIGTEHVDFRPRNLPEGATRLYDKDGTFVFLDADGNLFAETRKKAAIKAGEEAVIEAPTIRLKGNLVIEGNIAHVGNYTQTGIHVDLNGTHK